MKDNEQTAGVVELGGGVTKVFDVVGDRIIDLEGEIASLKDELEKEKGRHDMWYRAYQRESESAKELQGKLDEATEECNTLRLKLYGPSDEGGAERGFALADALAASAEDGSPSTEHALIDSLRAQGLKVEETE